VTEKIDKETNKNIIDWCIDRAIYTPNRNYRCAYNSKKKYPNRVLKPLVDLKTEEERKRKISFNKEEYILADQSLRRTYLKEKSLKNKLSRTPAEEL
jgi:hypothetical protein